MAEKAKELFALLKNAGELEWGVGFPDVDRASVRWLEADILLSALQVVSKEKYTEQNVNKLFNSMKGVDAQVVEEENFVEWVLAREKKKAKSVLTTEEISALRESIPDLEAIKEKAWGIFHRKAEADAVKAERAVKAEAALERMRDVRADETLADETIGDDIRKLAWLGFPEGDGPMAEDPLGYKDFVDGWEQGRAQVDSGGVHFSANDCSGVSAIAFFESMKAGDDFGFSVDGKAYYAKLAQHPRFYSGGEWSLCLDSSPGDVTAGVFQIVRHASNVNPETAKYCKFYEDRQPDMGAHFAEKNVCANCGVLRGPPQDTSHYVCGKFVRGPPEGYRDGRHRAFCATCGMPDDYHKACAKFAPGPSCTAGKFGERIVMCETCNFLESEHIVGQS